PALLAALAADAGFTRDAPAARLQFLRRLAALVGGKADDAELAKALDLLTAPGREPGAWRAAVLEGVGQGTQNTSRPPSKIWDSPPASLRESTTRARVLFTEAAATAGDAKRAPEERAEAVRLLAHGPFAVAEGVLPELLTARTPPEVQL